MSIGRLTIWNTAIAACLGVVLFSAVAHGGKKKMEPSCLYESEEASTLKPQELKLNGGLFGTGIMAGRQSSISLFPVPQENAVGTNDIDNAITLISFPKGRISFEKHFKNAVDDIGRSRLVPFIPVIFINRIHIVNLEVLHLYD